MSEKWIRASEVSDYLYCRRSWWLKRRRDVASQNVRALQQGTQYHQQHGRFVQQSIWSRRLAYVLIFVVVAVLMFQFFMGL